jgi:MSHA pilin protein MshD
VIKPATSAAAAATPKPPLRLRQRGLSLIELVVFIVVISAALAGVLQVFVQTSSASADPQIRRQALAVAESLLQEVQLMAFTYCDPDDDNVEVAASSAGCATLAEAAGPESGETRYSPPQFDNVNDHNGFAMNGGLLDITGTVVPGLSGYSASIGVAPAALGNLSAASAEALLITVTVNAPGNTQVVLNGYRSRYAPNAAL